ncbi:uncharacterized protein LOC132167394 [Corylus avellana]|uniref:uncharacterized protein LOC132167394 n=1 Tax=Corylus avellana TaxID=13451 RepID=UPI00286CC2D2|nr:uncharacterized protein LOC132167394 [Corylus avellana]
MKTVLQLADRSIRHSHGIIEDVIIKVDKFYFPVDFIVLDIELVPNSHKPILVILGRPFLAMANAYINCRTGVMSISFGNLKAKLNIFHAAHQPPNEKECFLLNTIEDLVEDLPPIPLLDESCEDPLRGDELITDPFWERHIENPHREIKIYKWRQEG